MIGTAYNDIKNAVRALTGISDTLLHVLIGLGLYIAAALVLRRGWRSPLPMIFVAIVETINEVGDYIIHDSWRWPSPVVDGFNTLALPMCMFVGTRLLKGRTSS